MVWCGPRGDQGLGREFGRHNGVVYVRPRRLDDRTGSRSVAARYGYTELSLFSRCRVVDPLKLGDGCTARHCASARAKPSSTQPAEPANGQAHFRTNTCT